MNKIISNNNKPVFESMAQEYIREDSHWGCDLDVIKYCIYDLLKREEDVNWLDIGCGSAFHITSVAEFYPEISITGLDYSSFMLRDAEARINRMGLNNITLKKVDIIEEDIAGKYDLITFMNNGLGNLYKSRDGENPGDIRKRVVGKIDNALNDGRYFVLSVYNRDTLGIDDKYGRHLEIIKELSNPEKGDFFCNYLVGGKKVPYYSHWFLEKELYELVEGTNLKLDFLESRMSRFVAQYKKVMEK